MAAPQKNAPAGGRPVTSGRGGLARLTGPRGILAVACVVAAIVIYLFVFGPLSPTSLPTPTRTPGVGAPLASAPHLVCDSAGTSTTSVSDPAGTLDEVAMIGRDKAPSAVARRASLYQITLDKADENTATMALVTWKVPENADPLFQISATRNGAGWRLDAITSCG